MRMLLPALTLALIGTAAHAADNGVYLGAGVSQVKLDNVGKDFNTGNLNDFKARRHVLEADRRLPPASTTSPWSSTTTTSATKAATSAAQQTFSADGKAYGAYAVGFLADRPHRPVRARPDWFAGSPMPRPRGPLGFRFDDKGTEFGWGAGAQARLGSLGGRLEYEQFDVDHTDGVEALVAQRLLDVSVAKTQRCDAQATDAPGLFLRKISGTTSEVTRLIFRVLRHSPLPSLSGSTRFMRPVPG